MEKNGQDEILLTKLKSNDQEITPLSVLQDMVHCKESLTSFDLDKTHEQPLHLAMTWPDMETPNFSSLSHKLLDELFIPTEQLEQNTH